jgi:uncharacterized protein (TIGR02231 family)
VGEDDEHVHAHILIDKPSPRFAPARVQPPSRSHGAVDNEGGVVMKMRTHAREQAAVSWTLATLSAAALACLCTPEAHAQESTRIVAATVFPDSASVERELRVPGGTRHITIACVPAAVDVSTLQVDGDAEARLGDVRATAVPESRIEDCAPPVAKARRDALALQRAALESQQGADELAFTFLQNWGTGGRADPDEPASAPTRGRAPAGVTRPGATAAELRKSALELLADQARVKRELEALGREETRVNDDQPVSKGKAGWRTVRFDVWSPAAATLRVRYNVTGTFWRPTYRASLDTARNTLHIDRQAEIVQASGEDWGGVRVRLSTRQPQRNAQADEPTSWWLDLVAAVARLAGYEVAPAVAAAPEAKSLAESRAKGVSPPPKEAVEPPPWATEMTQGDTVTEFAIAQPVTLPSDGETHTLQIGSQSLPVTLQRRTTPRTNPGVYLLAQASRPGGVWPAGPLQAYQDGTLVGRSDWHPADGEKFEIAMGQDDLMHVDIESPGSFTQSKGVFNGSVERTSKAVYAIVNQHPTAVTVEMLDAAPVSRNAAITVTHKYEPAPATTAWNEIPGVAAWTLAIPAQKTQRVSVTHVITAPKDAQIANLP